MDDAWQFLAGTIFGKFIEDNLPSFKIRKLKSLPKPNITGKILIPRDSAKTYLLIPISRLYQIPEFDIDVMRKPFYDVFYEVIIDLIRKFDLKENDFKYFAKNLSSDRVENKEQLIMFLMRECQTPQKNDSRYLLGFRSIWFILNRNIDRLEATDIIIINRKLKPFFDAYKFKHLFVPGNSF